MGTIANRGVIAAVGLVVCAGCEAPAVPVAPPVVAPCEVPASVWPERNTVPPRWGSGRTVTFAVSSIRIDSAGADLHTQGAGFDLDGRFNLGRWEPSACDAYDFLAAYDCEANCRRDLVDAEGRCARVGCRGPDCLGGVDNALPELVDSLASLWTGIQLGFFGSRVDPYDLRGAMAGAYSTGHAALVVQVSGVDSLVDDELVAVSVVRAVSLYSRASSLSCDAAELDRRYAIAPSAVIDHDPTRLVVRDGVGRIHRGRLRARFDGAIRLPMLDIDSSIREWEVELAQLAVDLDEERGARGNLGGGATLQSIVPLFAGSSRSPQLAQLAPAFVDLPARDGACFRRNECTLDGARISIGLRFTLVRAELEARVLDAAPPPSGCPMTPRVPSQPTDAGTYERFDASSFCAPPDAAR